MRKGFLLLLLVFVCSNSMAEAWIKVASTADGGVNVFADESTIRKEGAIVTVWTLGDFNKTETVGSFDQVMSLKEHDEYDCKKQLMRRLKATMYSGNMGRGDVLDSRPILEGWRPIPPGSLNEQLWKFVCG